MPGNDSLLFFLFVGLVDSEALSPSGISTARITPRNDIDLRFASLLIGDLSLFRDTKELVRLVDDGTAAFISLLSVDRSSPFSSLGKVLVVLGLSVRCGVSGIDERVLRLDNFRSNASGRPLVFVFPGESSLNAGDGTEGAALSNTGEIDPSVGVNEPTASLMVSTRRLDSLCNLSAIARVCSVGAISIGFGTESPLPSLELPSAN